MRWEWGENKVDSRPFLILRSRRTKHRETSLDMIEIGSHHIPSRTKFSVNIVPLAYRQHNGDETRPISEPV